VNTVFVVKPFSLPGKVSMWKMKPIMILMRSIWKNGCAPQNVTRNITRKLRVIGWCKRCSVRNYPLVDKLHKKKQRIKLPIEFDWMTTCIPFLKSMKMFVHIGKILCRPPAGIQPELPG